ncbi:polysaccharide deacetylase family protein [Candidatus Halobonum tyrrellensis]|uniref:Polysaccharide deacetylase n=1 Tax=Candidatus Halobonum tyrrellensis G22 TaxID=1324957 RepID=V4GNE4_9EURY|nr:polysaccharide deacetylase family protein [Candidatus Halobonum tyrrellensis]ESP86916.1 hypothetical protein K933_16682 [Candidatus Halobonum tyrrellensis G22]
MSVPDGHEFALCLTHDVDRPYKRSYRALADAAGGRPGALVDRARGDNSYWQFGTVRRVEESLGVRSSFYFLSSKHLLRDRPPYEWVRPRYVLEHLGRYDPTASEVADEMRRLDDGGWEVGLHGSYDSYDDRDRLRYEKERLETALGHPVAGVRQHYLNLTPSTTWHHHAALGLGYDTSLGSSTEYGFDHGYDPIRPFDDAFVVFPLTLMETALPDPGDDAAAARAAVDDLLVEAAENDAVMTALWHPRYFSDGDFPGYRDVYRYLVERALEMGAWVGSPGDLYATLDHPRDRLGAGPDGDADRQAVADDPAVVTSHGGEH